ncbi:MAG: DUF5671 domain-containing protein [Minisyncoccales bacterium]|jgi:hypothetical protein
MNSAKFAFYYMLSLVTLFIISISFGSIVFELINKFFPDIAKTVYYNSSPLKSAISGILIATPIFYLVMSKIYYNLKIGELKKDSEVRRWLTYFILFISSVVVIGSLIGILNNFLDGALTINFIFKALTVLFIASLIFGFYFYDIKRQDFAANKVNNIFFFVSLAIITCGFISSLFIIESPTEARNRKLDERIMQDFNDIKYAIDDYYNKNERIPNVLEELQKDTEFSSFSTANPINEKEYIYEVIDSKRYKLCTEFLSSNLEKKKNYLDNMWKHDKGYNCIEKEVVLDPNIPKTR